MQIVEVVLPVAALLETAGRAKQKSQRQQKTNDWIGGLSDSE
jgi:hypothetical protein